MEINKSDLRTEPLPGGQRQSTYIIDLIKQVKTDANITPAELYNKLQVILIEKSECRCEGIKDVEACACGSIDTKFVLGQFYFDYKQFKKAYNVFDIIKNVNNAALFQASVILYDDLLDLEEPEGEVYDDELFSDKVEPVKRPEKEDNNGDDEGNEQDAIVNTINAFRHPNRKNWELAVKYMRELATDASNKRIKYSAQYNIGKAYFQGFGVKQSDKDTEKWWLLAADDGNPQACVTAMTMLAFFYSRKLESEYYNLNKAYFWHNEACGNGSLESQGALGAIFYYGIGRKRNLSSAYECLTQSAERGNVYSMGILCDYYYQSKLYVKAAELSLKVSDLDDVNKISRETQCLIAYVCKGISMACFIYARCLDLGKGVEANKETAQYYYRKSYIYDSHECKLMQNAVTFERI